MEALAANQAACGPKAPTGKITFTAYLDSPVERRAVLSPAPWTPRPPAFPVVCFLAVP